MLFKKKKTAEKVQDDRNLIEMNSNTIEALLILAEGNSETINQLKYLKNQLMYLIPSDNTQILNYDKQIKNILGDLRIALTKSSGAEDKKATRLLTDVKQAIADRNVNL